MMCCENIMKIVWTWQLSYEIKKYKIHVKNDKRERGATLQDIIRPKTWASLFIYIYIYTLVI